MSTRKTEIFFEEDEVFCQRLLAGEPEAGNIFEKEYRPVLIRVLIAKGASSGVAHDVVADFVAECFGAKNSSLREPRLKAYSGKAALRSWLVRSVLNYWMDTVRRKKKQVDLPSKPGSYNESLDFDDLPAEPLHENDESLTELLRQAISKGFASLDPDQLLMIRLLYFHQIRQVELSRMWNTDQGQISKILTEIRAKIRENTLAEIKRIEPNLDVHWEDIYELAKIANHDFC